jgi:hypothetical protein
VEWLFNALIYRAKFCTAVRHFCLQRPQTLAKVQPTRARFTAARAWAEP